MSRFFPALSAAILPGFSFAAELYAPVQPFLNRYCVECHGEKKQKGKVRLDDLQAIGGALWSDIYDQLLDGDMPPEDELQPSKEERTRITKLVDQISRDDAFSVPTGYRRLNRREYANTVRDLLGLKPGLFDPAARIYHDEIDHGFDTNAEELVISNELLLEYLDSAEDSLRMALFLEDLEPPVDESHRLRSGKNSGWEPAIHDIQQGDRSSSAGQAMHFAKESTIEATFRSRASIGSRSRPPASTATTTAS